MPLSLRPSLRFSIVGDGAVFLDLCSGRYFTIPADFLPALRRWAQGASLSEKDLLSIERLKNHGILSDEPSLAPPKPFTDVDVPDALIDASGARPGGHRVLRACAAQLLWSWRVRRWPIARLLRCYERMPMPAGSGSSPQAMLRLQQTVRAFEIAGICLGSHDRCLARSLALAAACRRRRLPVTLVIAVRPLPFAAHSWVQHGRFVLNETPDRAQLFTPILFV